MTSDFLSVINQAVKSYRTQKGEYPPAAMVVDALLQAETANKRQKILYPFGELVGEWRLCFATGTRKVRERGGIILGKGFYIPKFVQAQISFTADGRISNQARIGGILLQFTGPAKYPGKKNLLAFDFTQIEISLFGKQIYQGKIGGNKKLAENFHEMAIAKLPFFAFFLITEDFIAARGRGGGLAIWIKNK
ncbi:hypothetical protein [Calothrix sp. 336/3]|uniref:hypothetical protein n=1 Tax=Calothrix sp. 336/3 TaxID=1337936 RepID=UPI0004E44E58|nr:hypothetical protein [Calothrix sp. 336/3]AKG20722.1 hypothetical protein IJ00_04825 [Calothrix sp. 336/3]